MCIEDFLSCKSGVVCRTREEIGSLIATIIDDVSIRHIQDIIEGYNKAGLPIIYFCVGNSITWNKYSLIQN